MLTTNLAAILGESLIFIFFFAGLFSAMFAIVFVVILGLIFSPRTFAYSQDRKAENATAQAIQQELNTRDLQN
ncbi:MULTISPECIES: hypothetical protein [unclassified Microcoleus]|uniref:hypothetical protein n=1 Tax=unclassified Microcoleus TaxID=2642155 RepID=UPI0025D9AD63|nr:MULTISPECIES: hypothetical protein [unclassified Microcoleus]